MFYPGVKIWLAGLRMYGSKTVVDFDAAGGGLAYQNVLLFSNDNNRLVIGKLSYY
jgi:hypothetical protein